jgi:hypothetical protein
MIKTETMGKVILEFDLIEEKDDIEMAINGYKYRLVLWELDQYLRSETKYNDNLDEKTWDAYDGVRNKIREIMNENTINFD